MYRIGINIYEERNVRQVDYLQKFYNQTGPTRNPHCTVVLSVTCSTLHVMMSRSYKHPCLPHFEHYTP
jgi:hypothetical protein